MSKHEDLLNLCRENAILALYLFGSRAQDGLLSLAGTKISRLGSDLDIGFLLKPGTHMQPTLLVELQIVFEEMFEPLQIDVVPLDRVDALFQYGAISGHRIAAPSETAADEKELEIMRRAADLLPIQRQIEIDLFGVATS